MPPLVYAAAVQLTLEQARTIIAAAHAEGRAQRFAPLTTVVIDGGGNLVAMEREDGAGPLRFAVAYGKASGALGLGLGSRTIGARNVGREAFLGAVAAASGGQFVPVAGGVLVLNAAQQVIGAVGVSGDTSDADEACAVAGIRAAGLTPALDPSAPLDT